jgi:hypothetical protein
MPNTNAGILHPWIVQELSKSRRGTGFDQIATRLRKNLQHFCIVFANMIRTLALGLQMQVKRNLFTPLAATGDIATLRFLFAKNRDFERYRFIDSYNLRICDCAYITSLGLGTVDSTTQTLERIADLFSHRPYSCECFWTAGAFNNCLRPSPSLPVLRPVAASNISNWGPALSWWVRFWHSRDLATQFTEMARRCFFFRDSCRIRRMTLQVNRAIPLPTADHGQ